MGRKVRRHDSELARVCSRMNIPRSRLPEYEPGEREAEEEEAQEGI